VEARYLTVAWRELCGEFMLLASGCFWPHQHYHWCRKTFDQFFDGFVCQSDDDRTGWDETRGILVFISRYFQLYVPLSMPQRAVGMALNFLFRAVLGCRSGTRHASIE
jgi:hypothetical protein